MACFMGTPWILSWRGFTQLARIGVFSRYALLDPIRLWVGLDIDPFVLVPKTGSLDAVFGFDSDVGMYRNLILWPRELLSILYSP